MKNISINSTYKTFIANYLNDLKTKHVYFMSFYDSSVVKDETIEWYQINKPQNINILSFRVDGTNISMVRLTVPINLPHYTCNTCFVMFFQ